jgi:hypothetical protein
MSCCPRRRSRSSAEGDSNIIFRREVAAAADPAAKRKALYADN